MDLNIQKNEYTGGRNCIFFGPDLKYYYADKSYCLDVGIQETMIFPYDKDKEEVSDWSELYCDRTGKSLSACIEEFNQILLIEQQRQSC
jgi:hypothetical protein